MDPIRLTRAVTPPADVLQSMKIQMDCLNECLARAEEAHSELVRLVRENPISEGVLADELSTSPAYARLLIEGVDLEEALGRHWTRPERAEAPRGWD